MLRGHIVRSFEVDKTSSELGSFPHRLLALAGNEVAVALSTLLEGTSSVWNTGLWREEPFDVKS